MSATSTAKTRVAPASQSGGSYTQNRTSSRTSTSMYSSTTTSPKTFLKAISLYTTSTAKRNAPKILAMVKILLGRREVPFHSPSYCSTQTSKATKALKSFKIL